VTDVSVGEVDRVAAVSPPATAGGGVRGWLTTDTGARITAYVAGLLLWTLLAAPIERIPGPSSVVVNLWQEFERGEVFGNFGTTMVRYFSGVAVATVAGVAIGMLVGLSKLWRAALSDIVLVGLSIPAVIWAFLTVMWFGLGWQAAFTATVLAATPFVAVNVSKGVLGISRDLGDMSRAYGVPLQRRIRHLVLPGVAGYVVAGVRFGMIIGWNAVLLAEWFGSSSGVGFRARYWYDAQRFAGFAAWLVLFIVFIVVLDRLVLERLSRRAFVWREAPPDVVASEGDA
jgi:NitT/TauT family transport system permease protein